MAILRAILRFLFLCVFGVFIYIISQVGFLMGDSTFGYAMIAFGVAIGIPIALLIFNKGPLSEIALPTWQYHATCISAVIIFLGAYFLGFFDNV